MFNRFAVMIRLKPDFALLNFVFIEIVGSGFQLKACPFDFAQDRQDDSSGVCAGMINGG